LHDIIAAVRGTADSATHTIVVGLRIPRVALAALCGAALAISGATYQALLRNTLAEPYILACRVVPRSARSRRRCSASTG
jgi:iron complex transport system permease protein